MARRHRIFTLAIGAPMLLAACMLLQDTALDPNDLREVASINGTLAIDLTAAPKHVDLGPVRLDAMVYNGLYAGPVLRLQPGDRLKIHLANQIAKPTNLHFHGIETSPEGKGDNVHVEVQPGQSFDYDLVIPKTQPAGLYWYHAHIHKLSEEQINAGLSGALIVEGLERDVNLPKGTRERLLLLKEVAFEDSPDPIIAKDFHDRVQTVNGLLSFEAQGQAGATELWRIGNHGANLYFHLALQGHKFRIIAEDGAALPHEKVVDVLDIGPASRIEALVEMGQPGTYDLVSQGTPTGSGTERRSERVLGHLKVREGGLAGAIKAISFDRQDLRQRPIDARRTVVFSEDAPNERYFVDGKMFDPNRVDTRVPLGHVERWTIRNDTDDLHVFHIHQVHFQVVSVNGRDVPFDGWLDTARVPQRGAIEVIIPFDNPTILGRFMYHCHVLQHEDHGMMAQIEIYNPHPASLDELKALLARNRCLPGEKKRS